MAQIISSAIVNAPPPHPVVKMLMRTNFACEPSRRGRLTAAGSGGGGSSNSNACWQL